MTETSGPRNSAADAAAPSEHLLAAGDGWSLSAFLCFSGPHDRPFEERHDSFSIALVTDGCFTYQSGRGSALLYPGAFLLGNYGSCYRCSHAHGVGDRCLSLRISPEYFAEISATSAGASRFRFPAVMLPPHRAVARDAVFLESQLPDGDPIWIEERVIALISAVTQLQSGHRPSSARASAQDERRIARVLRFIVRNAHNRIDLDQLAGIAAMSKFHFLRVFRRMLGITPYQYMLSLRLRRSAGLLLRSSDPVAAIAYESGFGDLSTFNARFRGVFGAAPLVFRRRGAAR